MCNILIDSLTESTIGTLMRWLGTGVVGVPCLGTHVMRSVYVCHLFNDCEVSSAELQDIARLMLTSVQNMMQAYLTASAENIAKRGNDFPVHSVTTHHSAGVAIINGTMSKQDLRWLLEEVYDDTIPCHLRETFGLDEAAEDVQAHLMQSLHSRTGLEQLTTALVRHTDLHNAQGDDLQATQSTSEVEHFVQAQSQNDDVWCNNGQVSQVNCRHAEFKPAAVTENGRHHCSFADARTWNQTEHQSATCSPKETAKLTQTIERKRKQ